MDQTTNKKQKNSKKLSILIAQGGLSFCTHIPASKTITDFAHQEFSEKQSPEQLLQGIQSFFEENFSEEKIEAIEAIYANQLYTQVPRIFFNETNLTDYLKFNTKILSTDFISFDKLKNSAINTVYIPYININNFIFEAFGTFHYRHATSVFIDNCLANETNSSSEKVYINVYQNHYDLCVIKKGKLILCNSFEYFSPEDFIYYLLFCIEQLKLDRELLQLILSGNITKNTAIYEYLYTYIRKISFIERNFAKKPFNTKIDFSYQKHHLLLSSL